MVLQGHLCHLYYIFTTTGPMAIKLGKVVTYYEKLPPTKLCNPLSI